MITLVTAEFQVLLFYLHFQQNFHCPTRMDTTCTQCPDDQACGGYIPMPPNNISCICGHVRSAHTTIFVLPEKGGYSKTGCTGFESIGPVSNPRTLCTRIVEGNNKCNTPYQAHANLMRSPVLDLPLPHSASSQRGPPAELWLSPMQRDTHRAGLGTTNDRRVASYEAKRTNTSTTSAFSRKGKEANHRVSRNGFGLVPMSGKRTGISMGKEIVNLDIIVLPRSCICFQPNAIEVHQYHLSMLISLLDKLHLVFTVSIASSDTAAHIRQSLNSDIQQNLARYGYSLPDNVLHRQWSWAIASSTGKPKQIKNNPARRTGRRFEDLPKAAGEPFYERSSLLGYAKTTSKDCGLDRPSLFICHRCVADKILGPFCPFPVEDDDDDNDMFQCVNTCPPARSHPLHQPFPRSIRAPNPDDLDVSAASTEFSLLYSFAEPVSVTEGSSKSLQILGTASLSDNNGQNQTRNYQKLIGKSTLEADHIESDDFPDSDEDTQMRWAIQASLAEERNRRQYHGSSEGAGPSNERRQGSNAPENHHTQQTPGATHIRGQDQSRLPPPLPPVHTRPAQAQIATTDDNGDIAITQPVRTRRRELSPDRARSRRRIAGSHHNPTTMKEFINIVETFNYISNPGLIVETTKYPVDAARAVLNALITFYGHPMPSDIDVSVKLPQSFDDFFKDFDVTIGDGNGEGPRRALLYELEKMIVDDCLMWEDIGNGFVTLSFASWESDKFRAIAAAYGTACGLILRYAFHLPSTISPCFFQALFKGAESIDDLEWLQRIQPSVYSIASQWPTDFDQPNFPQNDTVNAVIELTFEITAPIFHQRYASYTPQDRRYRRLQVLSKNALGLPIGCPAFDQNDLTIAFRKAMDLPLSQSIHLSELFGKDTKQLFPQLVLRAPENGDVLSQAGCIQWELSGGSHDFKFIDQFWEYIKGVGHVWHEDLACMIPAAEYEKHKDDAALRSRLFLLFATGQDLVPTHSKIKITFKNEPNQGSEPLPFHHIKALLDSPLPVYHDVTTKVATAFEVYLHSVFGAGEGFSFFNRC
ncbi:hypothetical protein EV361DRAFT_865822 [Lentinula raphanica]|nr:hypothetical protein EV361DRAFT_865822 [Lentinula raphanica]